jgi:GH15 family glucan-1,4-alpha-glucosidase
MSPADIGVEGKGMDILTHFAAVALLICGLAVSQASATTQAVQLSSPTCFVVDNGRVNLDNNASPAGDWDSVFDKDLLGLDRGPIIIGVRAEAGKKYVIAPAFFEAHWKEPGKRIVRISIEGKHVGDVDLVALGKGSPCAVQYIAEDTDLDGWIKLEITSAPESQDKNCILNALWVFEGGKPIDLGRMLAGKLNDKAYIRASAASLKPKPKKRIDSIGDGRLIIGNGHWLASFVGPIEEPEEPVYQVHDKISRLWLGYSSPQLREIGLAPRIKDLKSGKEWIVGACDSYHFEDGVMVLETKIEPGTVRTETYGLWDKAVMVRKITFTPNKGASGDFRISTDMSLYKGSTKKNPEQVRLDWCAYAQDERERLPALTFPLREELKVSKADASATWAYEAQQYRRAAVAAAEPDAKIEILGQPGKTKAVFEGDNAGAVQLSRKCGASGGTLTVVLAFDKQIDEAKRLLAESRKKASAVASVRKSWQDWFESGAVVHTGIKKLDDAYRTQTMYVKVAQDAELGGILVGARYQITTVWTRDGGVAVSALLDAGHYEEARKALHFFSKYAYWNERNNCMNANSHASGRTMSFMCGPGQPSVEDLLQPGEWGIQMLGPQLDGMGYYLYNIGKYYRCTGDKQFIQEEWPYIVKVADGYAADNYCQSESGPQGQFTDKHLRFKKYNPESGLIVDNCCEDGTFREMIITNAVAAAGFRHAYELSEAMGEAVPLWKQRADELDAAISKNCVRKDGKGEYLIENPSRPWINKGNTTPGAGGDSWTIAATVPYYGYTDQIFKDTFRRFVNPKGSVGGWGMWFGTMAHAAFAADWADCGWNYISKLLDQLPESLQLHEQTRT